MIKLLIAVLFIFVFTLEYGTGLQCYVCSTFRNVSNNCTDPFVKSPKFIETCDLPDPVCLKEVLRPAEGSNDTLHRNCITKKYCKDEGKKSKYCSTCEADLCNSASMGVPSFIAFFVPVFGYYVYNH